MPSTEETGLAVIGGTGLTSLNNLQITRREVVSTPYGEPSGPLTHGEIRGTKVVFLPRHGHGQNIAPHRVNYRANLWALRRAGARRVLAVNAVGGIHPELTPGRLAIPDQIVDYTWSRAHTFYDEGTARVTHIDFTTPYCATLRGLLLDAGERVGIDLFVSGTYGATQGPRLETAAEIDRMERDGCDMVGMTGMPETALARELELCYASCAVCANHAAGRGPGMIRMDDIEQTLKDGMTQVRALLEALIPLLDEGA